MQAETSETSRSLVVLTFLSGFHIIRILINFQNKSAGCGSGSYALTIYESDSLLENTNRDSHSPELTRSAVCNVLLPCNLSNYVYT